MFRALLLFFALTAPALAQQTDPNMFHPPATLAASGSWTSLPIPASSSGKIAVVLMSSQAGTLTIQRYIDGLAQYPLTPNTFSIVANTLLPAVVADGLPFVEYTVTITNSGGSTATLSAQAL